MDSRIDVDPEFEHYEFVFGDSIIVHLIDLVQIYHV